MAKKSKKDNSYDFAGLPITELITKPLIAVVIAQTRMAEEQVRALLHNCFHYNGEFYEPKMLKMTVTRGVLEAGTNINSEPEIHLITTHFYLPLITIFPFSPLGVETVNIDFEIEIMTQYSIDIDWDEEDSSESGSSSQPWKSKGSRIEMLGKISPKSNVLTNTNVNQSETIGMSATYSIDVAAGPIPLTKGLLTIIDVYAKAIEPLDMPVDDSEKK